MTKSRVPAAICWIILSSLPCRGEPGQVPPPFEGTPPAAGARESTTIQNTDDPFDPDHDRPKMIRVTTEFFEMSNDILTELLSIHKPESSDATNLRTNVLNLTENKTTKMLETQVLTARSGQKSTLDSALESIFPTEYEPFLVPENVTVEDGGEAVTPSSAKALAALVTPATPTAFETRNVGSSLVIEPTLSPDNRLIDLRFEPNLVWHEGTTKWHERTDPLGNISTIEMPDFYSMSVHTALVLIDGQYTLAAVLSPKNAEGKTDLTRKVMLFVKADVLVVK